MGGSLLSDRAVPVKGLSHEMDLSFEENGKSVFLAERASLRWLNNVSGVY
jgi:hypothetical protein